MDSGSRVVLRPYADRGRHKHVLHAIALLAVLSAAGCGGSGGSPTIAVQPARQYRLDTRGLTPAGSHGFTFSFRIVQPDGKALTKFRRGAGPHTGVHVIYVRRDLGEIVHHHPPVAANGSVREAVLTYAKGRNDPLGPLGSKEYLVNMDRYCGFVYHALITDLIREAANRDAETAPTQSRPAVTQSALTAPQG